MEQRLARDVDRRRLPDHWINVADLNADWSAIQQA
jgi:hypothetical protein